MNFCQNQSILAGFPVESLQKCAKIAFVFTKNDLCRIFYGRRIFYGTPKHAGSIQNDLNFQKIYAFVRLCIHQHLQKDFPVQIPSKYAKKADFPKTLVFVEYFMAVEYSTVPKNVLDQSDMLSAFRKYIHLWGYFHFKPL